jgi:hypothetical protein
MPITGSKKVKLFQTKEMGDIESQVNSFLSTQSNVTDVSITPVYSTILEETILQGYFGVVFYQ